MSSAKANLPANASMSLAEPGRSQIPARLASGQSRAINTPLKASGGFLGVPFQSPKPDLSHV